MSTPPLRFNKFKCHNNVELSEGNTVASATRHAWGGVTATWVMEGVGSSYFEMRVEESRMGLGLYVGLVDSAYKPHLRGQGMNSQMVPAKCAYEYCNGWSFYAHSGDLIREGRVVGHTGRRARKGDVIGVAYDAVAQTASISVNGELLVPVFQGVVPPVAPVVDLALGASVRILQEGCRADAALMRTTRGRGSLIYEGEDPRGLSLDMDKVGKMEAEFAAAAPLMLHRQKHEEALRLQFVEGDIDKLDALNHTATELANMDVAGAGASSAEREDEVRRRSIATRRASLEALAAADEAREAAAVHHSDADRLRSVHE